MKMPLAAPRVLAFSAAAAFALTGCTQVMSTGTPVDSTPAGTHDNGLPITSVWTSYPVGTSNYAEQAAVAEVLISDYDMQVRMVGSSTAMGRVTPLRTGQAQFARLSDEAFYAFEGKYEFVAPEWGPQDLRNVWLPPTTVTVGTLTSTGIETLEDLEGKRVPWMTASPSAQEKILGILDYAGLEPDDVQQVPVEYADQPELMDNDGLDMVFFGAESPAIVEIASQKDFRWIDFDGDEEDEARLQAMAPTVSINEFQSTIGMEDEDVKRGPTYPIQIVTYADFDADEVYALVKAFHESFPRYENATATTKDWKFEDINWMPQVLPHHEGLIRYLEEHDMWTEEHEERNQVLIERGEKLREGWPEVLENTPENELEETWEEWKNENAPHIPVGQ